MESLLHKSKLIKLPETLRWNKMSQDTAALRRICVKMSRVTRIIAHLVLSLDHDDGHGGDGPAVLRGERLVAVPQHDDLKVSTNRGSFTCAQSLI